jgi:ribosomal protein L9
MIDLPNPIRATGTFTIPVKVAPKLEPTITVNVVGNAESATAE